MYIRMAHYTFLITVSSSLFFVNLGGASLWDVDEGRNATCAYEMMEAQDWVVPTFNGDLRVDKPALLYWLQITAYHIFGVDEFAARLPSAIAALLTVLMAYELARRMFDPSVGLLTGLILACTPMMCAAARFANPDALLNFCTVLTMYCVWRWLENDSTWWLVAAGAASGLACLAKGPVGIVVPCAILAGYLLWTRNLRRLLSWRIAWGVLAWCCVALPWYVMVARATKYEFLRGFLFKHNVGRFLSPMEQHAGPFWYYPAILLIGFSPWSVFLIWTIWHGARSIKHEPVFRFLSVWVAVYLLFFTLAATKLPNYVLPMTAPLAMLTAVFLDRWRRGDVTIPAWWMRVSLTCLICAGTVTGFGMLLASGKLGSIGDYREVGELGQWALVGLLPVIGGIVAWRCWHVYGRMAMLRCFAAAAVAFLLPLSIWFSDTLNVQKAPRPLVAQSGACQRFRDIRVGGWQIEHLPSLNFYVKRDVIHHLREDDVTAFLRYPLPVFLFLPETEWERLRPNVRGNVRVVSRHFDLYRNCRIVVVVNRSTTH